MQDYELYDDWGIKECLFCGEYVPREEYESQMDTWDEEHYEEVVENGRKKTLCKKRKTCKLIEIE